MRRLLISELILCTVASTLWLAAPPTPASAESFRRPRVVDDHIPYGERRKRQMARYSRRHYGHASWRLRDPRVLVLHFTAGDSYSSARGWFASNTPNRGEYPGVCAQYLIGKGGKTGELVRPRIRCRHAIGLNHRAIGIEMVQETGRGSHWAARQILQRREQIRPALKLVRYLKLRFDIRMPNIIGHAMTNNSPFFRDLMGWRSDHTDWMWREVKEFRRRLRRML